MTIEVTEELTRNKSSKALLWLGIVSIIMLFAGLTSAYIIRQAKGEWIVFELPVAFYLSTFIILSGSVTLIRANSAAKKNNYKAIISNVGYTLILAIAFILSQILGWKTMTENGIFFTGPGSNVSASFLYVVTALHAGHVLGGIIALIVIFRNALKKKYSSDKLTGLQVCSTYWHFLGALWIYLLIFLLYLR